MNVKDLIANLENRNQEGEVYLESDSMLLDIQEVTFGKDEGKEFTVIIPEKDEE
ncbi:hypothetical protein [Clostridium drakei]|uniref:hypothetical protein n=1 Tax=Clostridium drakei TaxID=332101 RepID=UPI000AC13AAC|nr:hypothetical protein [Clostridium drakei]